MKNDRRKARSKEIFICRIVSGEGYKFMGYEFLLLSHYKFFWTRAQIYLYFWGIKSMKSINIFACGMGVKVLHGKYCDMAK